MKRLFAVFLIAVSFNTFALTREEVDKILADEKISAEMRVDNFVRDSLIPCIVLRRLCVYDINSPLLPTEVRYEVLVSRLGELGFETQRHRAIFTTDRVIIRRAVGD